MKTIINYKNNLIKINNNNNKIKHHKLINKTKIVVTIREIHCKFQTFLSQDKTTETQIFNKIIKNKFLRQVYIMED